MALFHFDLRHVQDASALRVLVHDATYDLQPHTSESLAAARQSHPVLAALPGQAHEAFTHFAEVDDARLEGDEIRWVQAVRPAPPGVHLHEVVLMAQHLPEGHLRAYYEHKLRLRTMSRQHLRAFHRLDRRPRLHTGKLASLGLAAAPADHDAAVDLLVQSQKLVTSMDTAASLVAHHPNLANTQPYTATVVLNDHVLPDPEVNPEQYNAMQIVQRAIEDPDNQSWSPVIPCKDQNGNLLTAGYDLDDGSGQGFETGQQLYTYGLADNVQQSATAASGGASRTASDDTRLADKLWSPALGTTALVRENGSPATHPGPAAATGPAYKWVVSDLTEHHGVSVDSGSIKVDGSDNFSIDASNSYLRTLYAGYQLYDDSGQPSGDKGLLGSISAGNTLMGIPVPTDPTALGLDLNGAASVKLYFGSLGTTNWDEDVSWRGALLTGLWQYGIPVVFLVAGKALTSTSLFNKIVNDRDLLAATLAVAGPLVGAGVATKAALTNTKSTLFSFANVVLGIVVQKGMEKLGQWLAQQVAAGAISNAFGPVGWVFRLVATGMDVEAMAVTTGEVLSSPACITVTATRSLDVTLTLHPDPRHGEAGHPETAVWPAVAAQYVATLQYKDGTNRVLQGQMPATTSNTPLPLRFESVPAGGEFRIIVGVYSANGWLAGSWQSDWMDAKPNQGTTLDLGDESITEKLVPLAPDSQYVFKERIVNRGGELVWQAGGIAPATTLNALDCGPSGTLCEIVGASINDSAFQVGYAWRASGLNLHPDSASAPLSNEQLYSVQNISVLTQPGSRLITTNVGFTNRPAVGYAPSTNSGNEIDQTNFVLDPRGGGMNLRQVLLDKGETDFGFGQTLPSWGSFPLENIDAMATHPSNAMIACSYQEHKLMILGLPAAPSPDGQAPVALEVSGEGIRQGLLQGPKALAVAPDGRILVLETLNRRIQAFDTKGNPVPSFTPGGSLFTLETAQVAQSLDAGELPEAFHTGLQSAGANFLFTLSSFFIAQLDSATFQPSGDALIQALSEQGVLLAYDPENMADPTASAQIQVVRAGQSWIITDPRGMAWQVLNQDQGLSVFRRPSQVEVRAQQPGEQWLLLDHGSGSAWKLAPSTGSPGQTEVRVCLSYFPLRGPRGLACTYLDMAVEAQGYVYVLSYWNDGSKPGDYVLDVYAPDGTFSFRTPDPSVTTAPQNVVAGRISVDIWRNLYALTYETLQGPKGGPQPGLAHWMPTPPLFTLALSYQADFNEQNIGTVVQAFAANHIVLSNQAFITVQDSDGAWQVKDGATIYHVYRSGDGLQVYAVPA